MATTAASPATPPSRRDIQRRTILVLAAGLFLNGIATGTALTVAPLLTLDLTGSGAYAGLPLTAASVTATVMAQPLAVLALRRGRGVALSTGLLISAVGAAGMLLADVWDSFALLLVGGALMGPSFTVLLQARFAATDLADQDTRARDVGLVIWAITPGAMAGPNLVASGAALSARVGLPPLSGPFLLAVVSLLLGALVLFAGLRPDPLLTARTLDQALTSTSTSAVSAPAPAPRRSFGAGLTAIRTAPLATLAVATMVVSHTVMVAIMSTTPVHLQLLARQGMGDQGSHATLTLIGISMSLHFAGMYALSPLMGWLADRVGRPQVMLGALGSLATATVVAGIGQGGQGVVSVGLVFLGVGWSAAVIAGSALLGESVRAERRVSAQGVADTLIGVFATVGAAGSGLAYTLFGFGLLNWAALTIVAAVTLWSLIALRRRAHQPSSRAGASV